MTKNKNNEELDKAMENLRVDLNRLHADAKYSPLAWVLPLTTLMLVIFKCLGYISISWWWVFAPIWAPITIVIVLGVIVFGLITVVSRS